MAKKNNRALPHMNGQWLMAEDRVEELFGRLHAAGKTAEYRDGKITPADILYTVEDHVATIPIVGVLTKYKSGMDEYCGFCPAEGLMEALNLSLADPDVRAINLVIDSPGGMVDGTTLFAEAVAKANKTKRVYATISDMCGSGGYWIASQCHSISANDTAFVGCIGVYTVLVDSSKFWSEMGVNFTLVGSGGVKGHGADKKVTPELVSDVQREITGTYERFVAVVAKGRGMSIPAAQALADGRSWIAKEAKQLGLIDSVASPEAAMTAISERTKTMTHEQFMSSLAENPGWIAGEREQAKKLGAKETRDAEKSRLTALREACGGNDSLACELFTAGKDAEDAKITVAAIARAKADAEASNKAQSEALAKANAEIERLKAEAGTQPAVGTAGAAAANAANAGKGGAAPERPATDDRKAIAAWAKDAAIHEWDNDESVRSGFSSKENYVLARAAELRGDLKIASKK
jgi:signal peptide peptidase SppA